MKRYRVTVMSKNYVKAVHYQAAKSEQHAKELVSMNYQSTRGLTFVVEEI